MKPSSPPLVAVLGASGMIGSAVTKALARRMVRVRAVARRPSVITATGLAEVEVRTADLTDRVQLAKAVADADVVVHLVKHIAVWRTAETIPDSERVNVGVMHDLVDVLRTNNTPDTLVIYSGAVSQVGVCRKGPVDGSETDRPATAYDRQKLAAENTLKVATAQGVLRGISLRLPTVFGPGPAPSVVDLGVITTMVRRALAGQELPLWHDRRVDRDLLYADDVADAVLAAIDHAEQLVGGHWVIGSDRADDLGEVFRQIADTVAVHVGRQPVPVVRIPPPAHASVTDFESLTVDSSAFRARTGWLPKVPLEEALDRTVAALALREPETAVRAS